MPRTARLDIPGQLYHVIARGIERRDLFQDDIDRESFLVRFSTLLVETGTQCLAWVLMSNHIHLLLRPGSKGLSVYMRRLLTGHAVAFNRRHRRVGHLFQNRYHSLLCEEDSYLLPLIRYIHLNPIQAGMVSDLSELDRYPWCGHSVLMGHATLPGQKVEEVLGYFGKKEKSAQRNYRAFLGDGIKNTPATAASAFGKQALLKSLGFRGECCEDGRILGSQAFAEKLLPEGSAGFRAEIDFPVLLRRVAKAFSVTSDELCSRSRTREISDARALICYLSLAKLKLSGAEVANHLGVARSSVTRAIRRGEELAKCRSDLVTTILGT